MVTTHQIEFNPLENLAIVAKGLEKPPKLYATATLSPMNTSLLMGTAEDPRTLPSISKQLRPKERYKEKVTVASQMENLTSQTTRSRGKQNEFLTRESELTPSHRYSSSKFMPNDYPVVSQRAPTKERILSIPEQTENTQKIRVQEDKAAHVAARI
jgi:hypothetical protein